MVRDGHASKVYVDGSPGKIVAGPAQRVHVVDSTEKAHGGKPLRGFAVDQDYIDKHGVIAGPAQKVYISDVEDGSVDGATIPMFGLSSGPVGTYEDLLVNTYGADEVWPLVDVPTGPTVDAHVNSNRDGTSSGVTWQDSAGPVSGTLAPRFGAGSYVDVFTSNGSDGLADIWDINTFSIFFWVQMLPAAWTNGTFGYVLSLVHNSASFIEFSKLNSVNNTRWRYSGQSILEQTTWNSLGTTNWFSIGASVDIAGDAIEYYIDGISVGSHSTLTVWSGNITAAWVGALNGTPQFPHFGWLSYFTLKLGSIWTPTDFLNMHNAAATF